MNIVAHFHCYTTSGGAKILEVLGKELDLDEYHMKPSYAVLRDYGNVSSSTTWYSLGWLESCRGVRKGDRILQIGVGSGVKCGVAVWEAAKDIVDVHDTWRHHEDVILQGKKPEISGAHGLQYFTHRLFFVIFMVLVAAILYSLTNGQILQI